MKVPFNISDFSGGMKGRKGQLNSSSITNVQDLNNLLVERNNTLRSRSGATPIDINLLKNDKLLPFIYNGRRYYFVYDTLLNMKYVERVGSSRITRSAGGRRHVDMFSRTNSTLSPLEYLANERINHDSLVQGNDSINYTDTVAGLPTIDDVSKWATFKNFVPSNDSQAYLDLHLNLRKLTLESSPVAVFTQQELPEQSQSILYGAGTYHTVIENTFWWNRMFVLDEDFNIITNEIDIANFVSYDSGHEAIGELPIIDNEVRTASHAELQEIRETRYGGSELLYEVEVMSQGVMFYNREGKLPNMFMLLNSEGQTDGVLRDFRTLYLDEVPNGIFKTAPYFTLEEYDNNNLYNEADLRLETEFIVANWRATDNLITQDRIENTRDAITSFLSSEDIVTSDNPRRSDYANNSRAEFSYNVRDSENNSDVLKAFLPLTSDSSPSIAIDNIRFEEPDGQVRFASPSFANMDRDFLFPHDSTSVWQNEDLAPELPFIFSPNLIIYHQAIGQQQITFEEIRFSSPIVTLLNASDTDDTFAIVPMTYYSGGAIAKFNDPNANFNPVRITSLNSSTTFFNEVSPYLPIVIYAQVFGFYKYNSLGELIIIGEPSTFAARLGYFDEDRIFHVLQAFQNFVTTFTGNYVQNRNGFFSSSTTRSNYSFTIFQTDGGNQYSVVSTVSNQLSQAIGFNSESYFSSVIEFQSRLFLASRQAPDRLIFSSTNDFLEFSTVRSLVNFETDPVATRGGRELFGNESVEALHETNNTLRVITDQRIFTAGTNELGVVALSDPSDIITSGQEPLTINNFTYFVSGDRRDILLSVFSENTQRFEYYSVFSALNIDDETLIINFLPIDASYRMVVRTGQEIYLGTIIQANQVAWSRLTFDFEVLSISATRDTLFLTSEDTVYSLPFLDFTDLEDGVICSLKLMSPSAMANLVNVQKTNINYTGMRYHDLTLVGTFQSAVMLGSDARPVVSSVQGDVIDITNKNYDDIFDSIEVSLEGKQNRVIHLRGSLGV